MVSFQLSISTFLTEFGPYVVAGFALLAMWPIVLLIGRIVSPTILPFPWPRASGETEKGDKNKTVVLAGSYNPPHNGHLAMLSYLADRYGQVIVAIGINPDKTYEVTAYERASLVQKMLREHLSHQSNVRVEVIQGYIWRTVKRQGACIFFRGIRSWDQDGADERALQILNTWGPLLLGPLWWPLPTIFLEGHPDYNHISSTLIRDLCRSKAGVAELKTLVPESIATDIVDLYGGEKSST